MTEVLVPLAQGVEEIEAVIAVDVLRRAGWGVVVAGLREGTVTASRGVKLMPDCCWDDVDLLRFDLILLPGGGEGVRNLADDARVLDAIRSFHASGKWVAAVCAAPLVLQAAGILEGRRVTCHPAVADRLTVTQRLDEEVVVDGRLVTSQAAGTSFRFALTLVQMIAGDEAARAVAAGLVFPFET